MTKLASGIKAKAIYFSISYQLFTNILERAITCSHPFAAKILTMSLFLSLSISLSCPTLIEAEALPYPPEFVLSPALLLCVGY
jgi:hypothetical protein